MGKKIAQIIGLAASLLIGAGLLYTQCNNQKLSAMLADGNKAIEDGNALTGKGAKLLGDLKLPENVNGFPGNREKMAPVAKEAAGMLEDSAKQYMLAHEKFKELAAGYKSKDEIAASYYEKKSQAYLKFAESKKAFAGAASAYLDEKIADADTLNAKMDAQLAIGVVLDTESKKFVDESDKIMSDNPSKFEK